MKEQRMSYFRRYGRCDMKYCFRAIHTNYYAPDALGWATHVLSFCRKHSDTHEREVYCGCKEP